MITIVVDKGGMPTIYSAKLFDLLNKFNAENESFIVYSMSPEECNMIKSGNVTLNNLLNFGDVTMIYNGKSTVKINDNRNVLKSKSLDCLNNEDFDNQLCKTDVSEYLKIYTTVQKEEIVSYVIQNELDKCSNELLYLSIDDIIDYDYELLEKLSNLNSKVLKKGRR